MRKKEGKESKRNSGVAVLTGQELAGLPEYVPAELNLETIGFFSAGYKRRYPTEPHEAKVVNLGIQRQIRIVPSTYGYPNSEDLDLYRAFLKICDEHAVLEEDREAGVVERRPRLKVPVCFSTKKLLQYAGYKKNAQILRRVQDWIKRGVITGIEGGIYEARTRRIKEGVTVTLFGKAYLRGELMADGTVADTNYVWPAEWFCSNYFLRYFRPVDLAFHRRLERPIAKTLYPILETGWYAADGGAYAKSYLDLCTLMYIPYHKQLSLAKQQLDPSHEELRREGFLAVWEYTLDAQGKWNGVMRWWPGPKWFQEQNARRGQRDPSGQHEHLLALSYPGGEDPAHRHGPAPTAEPAAAEAARAYAHADRVKEFYTRQQHPRVSREKIEKEAKILERLEHEGFTPAEIDVALSWLLQNREKFGGDIHSLRLLPETIGQSLREEKKVRREKDRTQRRAARTEGAGTEDRRVSQDREERFRDLSTAEKEDLQKLAVANLIRGGYKAEVVHGLKSLVKSEIHRMLDERTETNAR